MKIKEVEDLVGITKTSTVTMQSAPGAELSISAEHSGVCTERPAYPDGLGDK